MKSKVIELFDKIGSFGDKIAFNYCNGVSGESSYSFNWVVEFAKKTAAWFVLNHVNSVAFSIDNSPLNALLYLGSWWQGIDCFPINPRLKPYEIVAILKRIHIDSLLIKSEQYGDDLNVYCAERGIKVYCVDKDFEQSDSFLQIAVLDASIHPGEGCGRTSHISSGSESCYRIHPHSGEQLCQYAFDRQHDMGFCPEDVFLIALSVNHAYAFSYQLLPALAMGIRSVILPAYSFPAVVEALNRHAVTSMALLPVMYHHMCQQRVKFSQETLRLPLVAGDYLTTALATEFRRLFQLELRNGLGMTEVLGYAQNSEEGIQTNRVKLFKQIEVSIEPLEPPLILGQQEIGEIVLRGAMLPIDCETPCLKTGDLGYVDSERYLSVCGRKKELIIKGGSNISPLELEEVLLTLEVINEVMVLGVPDELWGEKIVAMVSLFDGMHLDLSGLNCHLLKYLADYKAVDALIVADDLPKNATGKLDRKKARQQISKSLCR